MTGWPCACSIHWSHSEVEGLTKLRTGRGEGKEREGEIVTHGAVKILWLCFICDVRDGERVSDVVFHSSHVQCEWSSPHDQHVSRVGRDPEISYCSWRA